MTYRHGLGKSGVPSTIDALRSLSDAELETAIKNSNHSVSGSDLLFEATRRSTDRQTAKIVWLTFGVFALTGAVVLLTYLIWQAG